MVKIEGNKSALTIQDTRAYAYAVECIEPENKRVPKYVKLQCQSWLDICDGKNPDAYINEKTLARICKLLKLMRHPDLGCSMYEGLEDYAWLLIVAIFCTKCTADRSVEYYTTAILEIARKNFKTFISAVIFIIAMLTGRPMSRYFSVAPDLKLSKELQIAIKKIIKASPALEGKVFRLLRSEIRCELNDSDFTPLAYSEDKMDGKLANAFLADEAGAMDDYPVEAMRSSQITLKRKLGIIISTQYPNDNNVMITEIDISKKVLDGLNDSRRRFSLLYEPDDELVKEWETNDLVIYQANPVACNHDYIFDELKEKRSLAVLYESKRQNFLCKHCNIKYKSLGSEAFIDVLKVKECRSDIPKEFWRGKSVYLGLDLSQTEDNTAVAMACYDGGIIHTKAWGFIPAARVEEKSKREAFEYSTAIKNGECFGCGDEIVDYGFIEDFILSIEHEYGVHVVQCGFDRWNALSSVQKLESAENAIECVEIKQHSSILHVPTKLLKERILSRTLKYDNSLLLENNFSNARCTEDTNLNKYVNKKKSAGKVDLVVAIINALYLLNEDVLLGSGMDWLSC